MNLLRSTGVVLALAASLAAVGCGGGGSSSKSASTAAGVTSQNHAPLPEARAGHTAVRLKGGEILIVGGFDTLGNPMASTVIVSSAGVTRGPTLGTARAGHSAVLLSTGEVLIAGGQSDDLGVDVLDTSEIFDPQTQTITPGPALAEARAHHVAISYFDGANEHVLFAGGVAALNTQTNVAPALASSESYDVTQNAVSAAGSLSAAQSHGQIARLDTGGLLIVGGKDATGPAEAQLFDPQTRSFTAVSSVAARSGAAVASRGREVLVAGGQSATGLEDTSEVFDSLSSTFSAGALLGSARYDASATVVNNEIVLVGGRDASSAVNSVERLQGASIGASSATKHLDLATARYAHTATYFDNDQLLIVGGYDRTGTPTSAIEIVDLNAAIAAATSGSSTTTPTATGSGLTAPTSGGVAGMGGTPGATTPATGATTPVGTTPATGGTTPAPSTGSTTPAPSSGGSSGGSSLTSTLLQSALQALTASSGSGGGFSGFLSTFAQTLLQNLLGGGSTGGGSGLSGILSSLLGGGSGGATTGGSGLSGILSSLLGGGSGGATSGSGGSGLSGLLSSLLGGGSSTAPAGGSSGGSGLSGLLSSLLGGGSSTAPAGGSSSGGGLSGLLSSLFGGGSSSTPSSGGSTSTPSSTALTIQSMTPGQGVVGDQVTITGINFGSNVSVNFNGTPAGINAATINGQNVVTVVCTVPSGATTGMVTVTSGGQTANAGVFTVQ
jgi:Kelch motif protein